MDRRGPSGLPATHFQRRRTQEREQQAGRRSPARGATFLKIAARNDRSMKSQRRPLQEYTSADRHARVSGCFAEFCDARTQNDIAEGLAALAIIG